MTLFSHYGIIMIITVYISIYIIIIIIREFKTLLLWWVRGVQHDSLNINNL